MIKQCVVLDGKVIHIGEWDYQYEQVEVKPAVIDPDTKEVIEPAEYETVAQNPFPVGAVIEERDFEYDPDRGWYELGTPKIPTAEERMAALEEALLLLMMEG